MMLNNALKNGLKLQYSASSYNCQNFVNHLLDAVNINTPELKKFILQPTDKILTQGILEKISRGITNTLGVIDYVKKVGSKPNNFSRTEATIL